MRLPQWKSLRLRNRKSRNSRFRLRQRSRQHNHPGQRHLRPGMPEIRCLGHCCAWQPLVWAQPSIPRENKKIDNEIEIQSKIRKCRLITIFTCDMKKEMVPRDPRLTNLDPAGPSLALSTGSRKDRFFYTSSAFLRMVSRMIFSTWSPICLFVSLSSCSG